MTLPYHAKCSSFGIFLHLHHSHHSRVLSQHGKDLWLRISKKWFSTALVQVLAADQSASVALFSELRRPHFSPAAYQI